MVEIVCDFLSGCGFVGVEFRLDEVEEDVLLLFCGGSLFGVIEWVDVVALIYYCADIDSSVVERFDIGDPGLFEGLRVAVGRVVESRCWCAEVVGSGCGGC